MDLELERDERHTALTGRDGGLPGESNGVDAQRLSDPDRTVGILD